MFRNFDKRYLLLVLPLLRLVWPTLQYRVPIQIAFPFVVLWLFMCLPRRSRIGYDRKLAVFCFNMVFWFFVYVFEPIFWKFFDYGEFNIIQAIKMNCQDIIYVPVIYVIFRDRKFNELKVLLMILCIGIVLSGISSFRAGQIEGFEATRAITGLSAPDEMSTERIDNAVLAYSLGVATYATVYQFAFISGPVLICMFRVREKWLKGLLALTIFAAFLALRASGLGTPVMIFMLSMALAGLYIISMHKLRKLPFRIGIVMAVSLLVFSYYPSIFSFMAPPFKLIGDAIKTEGSLKRRFTSIAESLQGDKTSYAYSRYQLQKRSWEAFLENPFFGVGIYSSRSSTTKGVNQALKVGGHSLFLDMLGFRGLVGALPYYLFLWASLLFWRRVGMLYFGREWRVMPGLLYGCYLFGGVANPASIVGSIYIILPGLALVMPSCYQYLRARMMGMPMPLASKSW